MLPDSDTTGDVMRGPPIIRVADPGMRFGKWAVVSVIAGGRRRRVVCRCDCGTEKAMHVANLYNNGSRSCSRCKRPDTTNRPRRVRDMPPEYSSWTAMHRRCSATDGDDWRLYGSRGIAVCRRWRHFAYFLLDMGERPGPGWSIDRIDNDRGYEPDNCRWALQAQQMRNTRRNRLIEVDGVSKVEADWSAGLGLTKGAVGNRIDAGWDPRLAVTTPSTRAGLVRWRFNLA